jgi:hypothetical protein
MEMTRTFVRSISVQFQAPTWVLKVQSIKRNWTVSHTARAVLACMPLTLLIISVIYVWNINWSVVFTRH